MKSLLIIANWKENKDEKEALDFLVEFSKVFQPRQNVRVVICPQYIAIPAVSEFVKTNRLKLDIGTQNISKFEEGAHTGEISASAVKEFVNFTIIGHSERRSEGETDEDVMQKVEIAVKENLEFVVCVVNQNVPIPQQTKIVAYEPVEAIGTGNPDTPKNAETIAAEIKLRNAQVEYVLYGGSVTSQNVREFTQEENIDGVLVGGASLDPLEFAEIIKRC